MNIPHAGRIVLGLMLSLAAAGCVRTVEARKPAATANFAITRGKDGNTISWMSVKGQVYSVQMRDKADRNAKWEFHPQGINLVGTGGMMVFRDQPPPGVLRQYRPHLLPVAGTKVGGTP